jgi:predicted alpha/beta-hydrolase family hydrolase
MKKLIKKLKFKATGDARVSALYAEPSDANALLVLAHGAGADMTHNHMQAISDALNERNIATFRFNFPYMEAGKPRTDRPEICIETFANALLAVAGLRQDLPVFLGGHSFGGRMSSHFAASQSGAGIRGLIYFSFPLHAGKPESRRAEHMTDIQLPQLFLSGTRDKMADAALLQKVAGELPDASVHLLDTGDHSYKILKRTRQSEETIYEEAARVAARFIQDHIT